MILLYKPEWQKVSFKHLAKESVQTVNKDRASMDYGGMKEEKRGELCITLMHYSD